MIIIILRFLHACPRNPGGYSIKELTLIFYVALLLLSMYIIPLFVLSARYCTMSSILASRVYVFIVYGLRAFCIFLIHQTVILYFYLILSYLCDDF